MASVMLAGCKLMVSKKKAPIYTVVIDTVVSIDSSVKYTGYKDSDDDSLLIDVASVADNATETFLEDKKLDEKQRRVVNSQETVKRNPASAVTSPSIVPVKTSINVGKIVYHIPDTMISFNDYDVVVRISNPRDTNIIKGIIGKPTVAIIRVSSKMEVKLLNGQPDSTFQIRTINDGIQMIDSESYTEWKFSVKPLKSGHSNLVLVVSIISGTDVKQTVYTDNVQIISNPIGWWERFWSSEYKWLFTTFLIPIFIYFWKKKNKDNGKK